MTEKGKKIAGVVVSATAVITGILIYIFGFVVGQ